jgi:hypothetical protein
MAKQTNSEQQSFPTRLLELLLGSPARLFAGGVILLIISGLFDHSDTEPIPWFVYTQAFWGHFFRDLGIALWVSMAIAVAIERFAAIRRNEIIEQEVSQVQQNALGALYPKARPRRFLACCR